MIYLLYAEGGECIRLGTTSDEPETLGFEDFHQLLDPDDSTAGEYHIGVVPAHGGNLLFIPVPVSTESKLVCTNHPATSHYKWGNDGPITAPCALLVTALEDLEIVIREVLMNPVRQGFIDKRWALRRFRSTKHTKDCALEHSGVGITYMICGEGQDKYHVHALEPQGEMKSKIKRKGKR